MRGSATAACVLLAVSANASYIEVPWPAATAIALNVTLGYASVKSTGTRFNWYAATLDDLSRFSVRLPAAGCAVLQKTTVTSLASDCAVATNAGYFQFKAAPTFCLGELVLGGKVVQWSGDGNPLFAMTSNRTTVIGALSQADVAALGVTFGVSGFGTIVENGRVSAAGAQALQASVSRLSYPNTPTSISSTNHRRYRAKPSRHPRSAPRGRGDRPAHRRRPGRCGPPPPRRH